MKRFLLGLVLGVLLLPAFGYLYLRTGRIPVETSASPLPFERRLAHMAINARIERNPPGNPPIQANEANLTAGAKIYREHCSVCHGLADAPLSDDVTGMFPRPPRLVQGKGVTDDSPGETYWKAAYGIRLTGMPAYRKALTDEQIWQVSLFLAQAGKMPEAARKLVSKP
jgi:mono/diheme cytochrome c family protein